MLLFIVKKLTTLTSVNRCCSNAAILLFSFEEDITIPRMIYRSLTTKRDLCLDNYHCVANNVA